MKIATYNVWNENKGIGNRYKQLVHEIKKVDADIIGLQEVTTYFYENILQKELEYSYCIYGKYSDEDEGIAILSKYPITKSHFLYKYIENGCSRALNAIVEVGEKIVSFTTLHLPWDSALQKEKQICEIDKFLHEQMDEVGLFVLAGDFNGGMGSSVHRYLVGDQSLNGCEAKPYWDELATAYQALSGEPIKPTLDVLSNPRWTGCRSAYPPTVMDRIYTWENWYDISLESLEIFGTEISEENHLAASDHYGVVAEVVFDE